jgi:hypothetical protein
VDGIFRVCRQVTQAVSDTGKVLTHVVSVGMKKVWRVLRGTREGPAGGEASEYRQRARSGEGSQSTWKMLIVMIS